MPIADISEKQPPTPYSFVPLWQFAWQNVKQLALRFAISHLFEHFSNTLAVNATKDQLKAMPQFDYNK